MIKRITAALLLMSLLISQFFIPGKPAAAAEEEIRIESSVSASPAELEIENGKTAETLVKLGITPKGKAVPKERTPIDVVFVFDKSGSMKDKVNNKSKIDHAKNAMNEAITMFKENNKNLRDRFALVTFDSTVNEANSRFALNSNLDQIRDKISGVSPEGGTNYTESLEKARMILESGKESGTVRNQHIIFMTDGKPTHSQKIENVVLRELYWSRGNGYGYRDVYYGNRIVNYAIYSNNSVQKWFDNYYQIKYISATYTEVKKSVESHAMEQAGLVAGSGILLNSIGFGKPEEEVDMKLLNSMSQLSLGEAQNAVSEDVVEIFKNISKNISSEVPVLSNGHIVFTLPEGATIKQGTAVTELSDGNYRMNIQNIEYKPEPSSANFEQQFPIIFSKAGTYDFKFRINYNGKEMSQNNIVVKVAITNERASFDQIIIEVGQSVDLNNKIKIYPDNSYNFIQSMQAGNGGVYRIVNDNGIYRAIGLNAGFDTIEARVTDGKRNFNAAGTVVVTNGSGTNPDDSDNQINPNPDSSNLNDYKW